METISRAAAKQAGEIYYFTGQPCAYGHISKRFVRNYTCIECESARGRGELLLCPLSQCAICGADVRVPGHATCSAECGNKQAKAKELAKRELKYRKRCHGCGAVHYRFHKWFCSNECYQRHQQRNRVQQHQQRHLPSPQTRECVVCGAIFSTTMRPRAVCSPDCARRREVRRATEKVHWRQQNDRAKWTSYVRERNRELRAKVAANGGAGSWDCAAAAQRIVEHSAWS